jgi:hypothetical protein
MSRNRSNPIMTRTTSDDEALDMEGARISTKLDYGHNSKETSNSDSKIRLAKVDYRHGPQLDMVMRMSRHRNS